MQKAKRTQPWAADPEQGWTDTVMVGAFGSDVQFFLALSISGPHFPRGLCGFEVGRRRNWNRPVLVLYCCEETP